MQVLRPRCPKCSGRLYLERDSGSRFHLPSEWCCLQCGWRRTYTPRQLAQRFAIVDTAEQVLEASP